jgi:hypothetical protein
LPCFLASVYAFISRCICLSNSSWNISSCKTCGSHLLEYIVVYIIVGVSSPSRGICELLGSGEAQEVVSFPHSTVSSPDALFGSSNALRTWPLPGTWYKVHSFERIRGAKWL